jgi:hypothetical protein
VDPVPDHHFSENLVARGIEPGTSGSVAKNCDHKTTEAASIITNVGTLRVSSVSSLYCHYMFRPSWAIIR